MMKGNDMICEKCKKTVRYGRGWAHVVAGNKDYHMDCYLNIKVDYKTGLIEDEIFEKG